MGKRFGKAERLTALAICVLGPCATKVARGFFFFALRLLAVQAALAAGGSGRLKRPEQPACPISRPLSWRAVLAPPGGLPGPPRRCSIGRARPGQPTRIFLRKEEAGRDRKMYSKQLPCLFNRIRPSLPGQPCNKGSR